MKTEVPVNAGMIDLLNELVARHGAFTQTPPRTRNALAPETMPLIFDKLK